jgi:hypothetical protein
VRSFWNLSQNLEQPKKKNSLLKTNLRKCPLIQKLQMTHLSSRTSLRISCLRLFRSSKHAQPKILTVLLRTLNPTVTLSLYKNRSALQHLNALCWIDILKSWKNWPVLSLNSLFWSIWVVPYSLDQRTSKSKEQVLTLSFTSTCTSWDQVTRNSYWNFSHIHASNLHSTVLSCLRTFGQSWNEF